VETVDLLLDNYVSQKEDILNVLWLYVLMILMASEFGLQFIMIKACGPLEQIFFGYHLYLSLPAALFIAYSCICASRLSLITEGCTVFRFTDVRPLSDGTGSVVSPALTKRSSWSIMASYISINWYLIGVAVLLYGLNLFSDRFVGPLPHSFLSVLYPILYLGGFFLYTVQIFDNRTNVMLIVCSLQISFLTNENIWGILLVPLPFSFYDKLTPRK
jgi:hypothetical protein